MSVRHGLELLHTCSSVKTLPNDDYSAGYSSSTAQSQIYSRSEQRPKKRDGPTNIGASPQERPQVYNLHLGLSGNVPVGKMRERV